MAVSVAVNLLGAGILVLVFPCMLSPRILYLMKPLTYILTSVLMHSIGTTGSLSIFAGLNVVAFVMVYLLVPETRMRTLEELQYTFDLPTRWHVAYRAGYIRQHVMKNWWRYVTRKKVEPPIPFYAWARITHSERVDAS